MTERESHTFLFADLAGFTALTEAHGDVEAAEIAEHFAADVRGLLPQYRAEEVKTIGDEVMVRVDDSLEAVKLGLRIVDELATPGAPPVRVGMHSGPALERSGDWFGATVNLASRVSGAANPGEVLVTADTRRQCGEQDGIEFEARGGRHFKHIPEPVPVYLATDATGSSRELEIDPVCRMAVDPHAAEGTKHWRGASYYFCSPECLEAFEQDPRRYVASSPAARAARAGFLINLTTFLIVGSVHVLSWAFNWMDMGEQSNPPMFVYLGAIWAIGLGLHFRAVRRVL